MRTIMVALVGFPILMGFFIGAVGLGGYLATHGMKTFRWDKENGRIVFRIVFVVAMMLGVWMLRMLKQAL